MIETRYTTTPSTPAVTVTRSKGGTATIVGYAAVFYRAGEPGTEFELWPGTKERIGRNAFDRAIKERHDARGLFNHDPTLLLGRVAAGTVRLSVDNIGLRYEIDAPDTTAGHDVRISLERGDLAGSSFAFVVVREDWTMGRSGQPDIRTILDVDLLDVSPVTYPAYTATTAGVTAAAEEKSVREMYDPAFAARRAAERGEVERMLLDADILALG